MSRRGRLRRRGNLPVANASAGAAVNGGAALSPIVSPVVRSDGRADASTQPDSPSSPEILLADVAADKADDTVASLMNALEVEVPIDLGTELRLAVAALKPVDKTPVTAPAGDPLARALPTEADHAVEELTDLGPIEPFFNDPTVTDILVTGVKDIYVERAGKLARADACFRDDEHLLGVIRCIVGRTGRHVDDTAPIVDARLPDGSRVNAIIPPLALNGPVLSIRRFGSDLDIETLAANGTLTQRMAMLLAACVHARLNVLISGGAGSGKTTLLNALSAFVPGSERLVTIEDAAELRLRQEFVVRLETRPPSADGRGEIEPRDLVRHALRMRPTRLIIGDLRGVEAADVLQAMNAGHEGSLATIHGSSPRDALARLENMALRAGGGLPVSAVREQIAGTIDVVVQIARLADGRRRVISITEVTGMESDTIKTNELFAFTRSGVLGGRVLGRFLATGSRPKFLDRLHAAGLTLPAGLFDVSRADSADASRSSTNGSGAAHMSNQASVRSLRDIGSADERQAREVRQLAATIRNLEVSLEQEKLATRGARATVEELRTQMVASRLELDVMQDEVRAARYDADEQRELQTMLQHRSRALAMAVMGFVEVLDELLDAGRESADAAVRDRAVSLRDAARRLLALFGLTEITGVGTLADETHHEIVHRVPSDSHPSGVVVAVIQRGVAYHGQTVRKAQVLAAQ